MQGFEPSTSPCGMVRARSVFGLLCLPSPESLAAALSGTVDL